MKIIKFHFDKFNIDNMEEAEKRFKCCPECGNKNVSSMVMLGEPKEYNAGMLGLPGPTKYPEGETFICKDCNRLFLVIYDSAKEKTLEEFVDIYPKHKP